MKKTIIIILICIIGILIVMPKRNIEKEANEYLEFYNTLSIKEKMNIQDVDKDIVEYINKKYQFSDETQEWIDFYQTLSDSEKASISYIPNELIEAINQGYIFYIK